MKTYKELIDILITCDGAGKEAKLEALQQLETEAFIRGQHNILEAQEQNP